MLAIEDAPAGLEAAIGAGLATLGVAQTYPGAALAAADHVVDAVDGLTVAGIHARFGSMPFAAYLKGRAWLRSLLDSIDSTADRYKKKPGMSGLFAVYLQWALPRG